MGSRSLAITMRTPGNDVDLAAGFLVSEGVVSTGSHLAGARYCAGATAEGRNTYRPVWSERGASAPPESALA